VRYSKLVSRCNCRYGKNGNRTEREPPFRPTLVVTLHLILWVMLVTTRRPSSLHVARMVAWLDLVYMFVRRLAHGRTSQAPGSVLYHGPWMTSHDLDATADIVSHLKIKQGAHWFRKVSPFDRPRCGIIVLSFLNRLAQNSLGFEIPQTVRGYHSMPLTFCVGKHLMLQMFQKTGTFCIPKG
jgi:hypothetical protein